MQKKPKHQVTFNDTVPGVDPATTLRRNTRGGKIRVKNPITGLIEEQKPKLLNAQGEDIKSKRVSEALASTPDIDPAVFDTDTYAELFKQYNNSITILDPEFSENFNFQGRKVLVRLFMQSMEKKVGGLTLQMVPHLPVQEGVMGKYNEYKVKKKKYPFVNAGVIVNVSEEITSYKKGDLVLIPKALVEEQGRNGTYETYLPREFVHYNAEQMNPGRTYGYIIVDDFEIIATINKLTFSYD